MSRPRSPLPAPLARAARRFSEWRSRRTGWEIPGELWSTAADLAGRYGVSRTARALRVQYYDLKKRVPPGPAAGKAPADRPAPARFVEIVTAGPAAAPEVVVEYEHSSGSRMRVRIPGAGVLVLAELARAFLGARS